MPDLTDQIAFVSGTSRGLGESFALTLAKAGADLVVSSRSLASLDKIKAEIEVLGRRCLAVECRRMSPQSRPWSGAAAFRSAVRLRSRSRPRARISQTSLRWGGRWW